MREEVDVLVVGASAAGLACAWAAASEGARPLLLEAREAIGVPPAPASVAFDFLWEAPFLPPASTIRRRHRGLRVRAPGGGACDVDAPLSILDRARFDQWLAAESVSRGATIETGVRDISVGPGRQVQAGGRTIRARTLVFADGARTLASGILAPQRHPASLAWGAVLELDRAHGPGDDRVILTLGKHALGGRSQLNPLEAGRWSHWTFYRGAAKDAEERARVALALDARLAGWPDSVVAEARFLGVSPDPVYTLPGELSAPGVLVTGGAGGQGGLEVGLGAGVMAGRVAARMATGHARPGDYERAWKREHLAGYRALRTLTEHLSRLDDGEVDRLLAPWIGQVVPLRERRSAARAVLHHPAAWGSLARAALRSSFRG